MYHWAGEAIQKRDGVILTANVDPALDSFRKEPRFRDILRQIGYRR
jgi:hypothetical protein